MRKPKSVPKKKKTASPRAPRRIENPAWIRQDPDGSPPDPPAQSLAKLLPFLQISWKNFERLCLRLSERDAKVEAAWAYGTQGHAQHGIDILVRMPDGSFHVWQSKRYKSISKAEVAGAVELFLKHKWANRAARFVLAVGCEFRSPAVVEAIEAARTTLQAKNIEFEPLDASKLTERLRTEPELIDDFFKRPWVEAVCPPEALDRLKNRLSRFDVASLRTQLRTFYASWISAVDPGLPIVDAQGQAQASIPITERYIQPDLLFHLSEPQVPSTDDKPVETAEARREAAELGKREPSPPPAKQPQRPTVRERRMSLDEYLSSRNKVLIIGEAGSGKSSLLRFLALDILSEQPLLKVTKERFRSAIPVWLPFAHWVRKSVAQGHPVSIEEVVTEFFRVLSDAGLAEDMRRAVLGKRIVLLVDGVDEASDTAAAQTVLAILTTFVDQSNIPVVATSRPHGARNLSGLGGSWDRCDLAALSDEQRHALANLWFAVLERFESASTATQSQINAHAKRKGSTFIKALQLNAAITRLSQTPLFLLAFLTLHRRGLNLPTNRFAASKEIVEQLIVHQPRRRDVSALSTKSSSSEPRLRDRVIADFAFALQGGDLSGPIPDAATEEQAVARATALIRERQQSDQESAETAARLIFSFTEERAGLLVNKAPGTIGFLHLSLQEYLAARHLMQSSLAGKLSFVSTHAGHIRWREPILYLLYLTDNEAEVGQLLTAIETAKVEDAQGCAVREALLTDAVFADFAHDLRVVRELAARAFEQTELTAWGASQRHLLKGIVDGLFSEAVGGLCHAKLAEWIPDRHGYGRRYAIEAIPTWHSTLQTASVPILLRCLRSENEPIWRRAAEALAVLAGRGDEIKQRLIRLTRQPPSIQMAQAAIAALGSGWSKDDDVGVIGSALRTNSHRGIRLDAIRICAKRKETDEADLDNYMFVEFEREHFFNALAARDLTEHFATYHREVFIKKLEAAINSRTGDRMRGTIPLIAALIICDPDNTLAGTELLQALNHDWILHDILRAERFPVDRVRWTPALIAKIEAHIQAKERFMEHDLYWISKFAPLPLLKQKFLEALRERQHLSFWCARGLAEVWGKTDPEVHALFTSMLTAEPKAVSEVAEELPLIVDDPVACREALLRAMQAEVTRYDFILKGCKNLGITADDEEMVQAALQAGKRSAAPLYRDLWCQSIIDAFPAHPQVREIALDELARRDGSLGTIARSYPNDEDMCRRVLSVLCPLDDKTRMTLLDNIEASAPSNAAALELLSNARQDTDGSVCSEAVMGWVEAMLTHGPLQQDDLRWLETELDAVGPEYDKRRIAAVAGLLLAGSIDRFARAKRYDGKPLDVPANPSLTSDDLYLRRLLPRWTELTQALGNEQNVLDRLELTPERTLQSIHGGIPGADHLFALLMQHFPTAKHVRNKDLIAALGKMAPRSNHIRDLVASLLLHPTGGASVADHWAELRAGEIFADYFRGDLELRRNVIDAFKANPNNSASAGALADLLLRDDDPDVAALLFENIRGRHYSVGTHFKLIAALAVPEDFIASIEELISRNIDAGDWSLPYWVPALLRRIKLDAELQQKLYSALREAKSVSLKLTLSSLLARGAGPTDDLKKYAIEELRKIELDQIPAIGFDLTSYGHRPLFQTLTELAA